MNYSKENKDFRILIVDDVPKNIQVLGNILMAENYQLSYSQNGKEALEAVKQNEFDLILLDIMMPVVDGYEVCRQLKSDSKTKDIPIIFLTAKIEKESVVKGLKLGAVDYVTKPFNADELLARVRTHLSLKDKTEQLQSMNQILEEKVAERTAQLREANEKLSTLEKAKSEFLTIISHELRTPLNGISGFAEILLDSLASTEHEEFIGYLKISADRLVRFSEMALLITQLNAEKYIVEMIPMNLGDIILSALEEVQIKLDESNINIEKDFTKDINVITNYDLIKKSLVNILENSINYSPENSSIYINTFIENESLIVEICDQGPGFSSEAMGKLFEYFSTDNLMHSEGLGLGLAAVKLVMDSHSGSISIQNKDEGGAKVRLSFPCVN